MSPTTSVSAAPLVEHAASAGTQLLKSIRKHWTLVAAITLLATGLSLLYVKVATPIYESQAMLQIDPRASQPLGEDKTAGVLDMGTTSYWDTREYYETQYKIIRSDRVLGTVARDLGLANDQDFTRGPDGTFTGLELAIRVLRDEVTVEPIKNSRLLLVTVADRNPARARRICDAVANTYMDDNLRTAVTSSSDAVVWLNGQLDHIKHDLDLNENALYEFKDRNQLPSTSINEASNMLRVEMQEYDTALSHIRTQKQELSARKSELLKVDPEHPEILPASEILASVFLQSLRTQYLDAIKQRDGLLAMGKGEDHPLTREAAQRVTTMRSALLAEVKNIEGAVERDLAIVRREEAGEAALFEEARRRAVELNMKEIEFHRLDRLRGENEKLYSLLQERMKNADLARMLNVNNVRIVDSATEPKQPVRPRAKVDVSVGLAFGLLLAITVAWLRDRLDTTVKTPDDVEQRLNVTFLGLLPEYSRPDDTTSPYRRGPRKRKRSRSGTEPTELLGHEEPLSGIAEAARSIRTNLMFLNPDRPCRVMLVSSAGPSEGKTTVACSIAIALAQGGQRVCIVDCDLRRPRFHRIFNLQGQAGVTNVLVGDASLDDIIHETVVPNLSAICAGPLPPNPADLLHSERYQTFVKDLAARFDRVIIDSPPLVAVTDAAIISRLVDGTLFVVRAFKTSRNLASQGLRALRDVDARVLGIVLNAVNLGRFEYSYYHYGYYRKGAGYGTDSPSSSTPVDQPSAPQ